MSVWSVKMFEDVRKYRWSRHPKESEEKKSAQESRVGMKEEGRK